MMIYCYIPFSIILFIRKLSSERDKSSRRSIDKADAIKKRFIWDNQSACLFRYGRKKDDDSNKSIGKPFIIQRMLLPCFKILMKASLRQYN